MPSDPEGGGLRGSQADACAMLKEERAPSLAQFLVRWLVVEDFKVADGAPVSQDVEKAHKFVMKTPRSGQNQGQECRVMILYVISTIRATLHLVHCSRLVSFTQCNTGTLSGCHGAEGSAQETAFRPHTRPSPNSNGRLCGPGLVDGEPTTPRRTLEPAWTVS